jgi:hypothetical protein
MTDLAKIAERDAPVRALADALRAGRRVVATGNIGPSVSFTALAVARIISRTVIVVCAHTDEAEDIAGEINALEPAAATIVPALELAPGETGVSAELFAQRATVLRRLRDGPFVTARQAFMMILESEDLVHFTHRANGGAHEVN